MNEIKVRAWDGVRMLYKGLHDHSWYTDPNGGKHVCEHNQNHEKRFKTMQYTGRKDKNGREIYAGDVVAISHTAHDSLNQTAIVYWDNDDCAYRLKCTKDKNWRPSLKKGVLVFKIVGNIYENPALTEVPQ